MKNLIKFFLGLTVFFMGIGVVSADESSRDGQSIAYVSDVEKAVAEALGSMKSACAAEIKSDRNSMRVARFDLQLNYTTNTHYTAFEIKASTNNFSHSVDEYTRLQFYAQSEVANLGCSTNTAKANWADRNPGVVPSDNVDINGSMDRMWLFTTTSNVRGEDNRSYQYIGSTGTSSGWPYKILNVVVLVDVEALERHRDGADEWLNRENEELVWVWCRYGYSGGEFVRESEEGHGNSVWRPVTPSRWYSKMPNWATNQISVWPRERLLGQMPL